MEHLRKRFAPSYVPFSNINQAMRTTLSQWLSIMIRRFLTTSTVVSIKLFKLVHRVRAGRSCEATFFVFGHPNVLSAGRSYATFERSFFQIQNFLFCRESNPCFFSIQLSALTTDQYDQKLLKYILHLMHSLKLRLFFPKRNLLKNLFSGANIFPFIVSL